MHTVTINFIDLTLKQKKLITSAIPHFCLTFAIKMSCLSNEQNDKRMTNIAN